MRAYVAHWRIAIREEWRYFATDGIWAGALATFFAALLILFYGATNKIEFFGTFSWPMMVWYLIAAQLLVSNKSMLVSDISQSVQDGSIASRMSKPYSLPFALLAEHFGTVMIGALGALLFMIPLGLALAGPSVLTMNGIIFFVLTALLSAIIDFGLSVAIGLVAFWTEDAKPYYWIYSKFLFILGGLFFPLTLLPGTVQVVAKVLPTAFMVYYPARLLVDFSWSLAATVVIGQILWCVGTLLLAGFVYSRAVRKVTTNGG